MATTSPSPFSPAITSPTRQGTGFVHTAPSHGADDFEIWIENRPFFGWSGQNYSRWHRSAHLLGSTLILPSPFPVDDAGAYTRDAPGFEGLRVIDDKGDKGGASDAVIKALQEAGALLARGRLKHTYPHSWRSKKPVIYRNTPQWFIAMDKALEDGTTLRSRALKAISETAFTPRAGQNRLQWHDREPSRLGHLPPACLGRADRGLRRRGWRGARRRGRQRAHPRRLRGRGRRRLVRGGRPRAFLKPTARGEPWRLVTDILDVWFDSGSTHAFVLEDRADLKWPADVYLEGSDQHRGWFHSSLLESCGTRGRAPYEAVVTHGFIMAEDGRKMSKSLGNQVMPQDVIKESGADILRLWVASSRLRRRPSHRQGDPQDQFRRLSPPAKHDPLDARLSGAP